MSHSKSDEATEYDCAMPWPYEQLERMNSRFVERVERAIAAGDENRQSAAAMLGAKPPRAR